MLSYYMHIEALETRRDSADGFTIQRYYKNGKYKVPASTGARLIQNRSARRIPDPETMLDAFIIELARIRAERHA